MKRVLLSYLFCYFSLRITRTDSCLQWCDPERRQFSRVVTPQIGRVSAEFKLSRQKIIIIIRLASCSAGGHAKAMARL
jgi:hypothetical protein